MDRSTLSRILLAVGVFFLVFTLFKSCKKDETKSASTIVDLTVALPLPPEAAKSAPCVISTPDFRARFGNVGAGLQQYELLGPKYQEAGKPIDLAYRTTHDFALKELPNFAPLRPYFRFEAAETQVPADLVEFTVEQRGNECTFRRVEPGVVEITHVVKAGPGRYELSTSTTLKNLAPESRKHTYAEGLFAVQFKSAEGGMLSRSSPAEMFNAGCSVNGKVQRKPHGDLTSGWVTLQGNVDFVEMSSGYIGQAIVPLTSGAHCSLVAEGFPRGQEADRWMLRAYAVWPQRMLAKDETASYQATAYLGPKERDLLAAAGGGNGKLDPLIDLGTFAVIAKVLVKYLGFLKGLIGSWGIAIILLTVTVRLALMPLTIPQIRSSVAMRKIKPELDAINKKHEGDQQMKMLATQQLYKKNGINPVAGCLPALLQMPVWFALYTALQTAMELYHEPFAMWHDLSSPDPRFILPLVLGVTMFIQQKVTPMQMDPAQQKIFTYFMPGMFTVFMLFLPAGLGVYMLTNSLLGIAQTIAVERYMRSHAPAEVVVKQGSSSSSASSASSDDRKPKPAKELARRKASDDDEAGES
jgi:YidC/Oxa1 family membrane protein insertase